MHRRALPTSKPLELSLRPTCQGLVEVAKYLNTLRPIEAAVVVHPAAHRRVDEPRQIFQLLVVPGGRHPPLADGRADRRGCFGADRRQEAHKELPPAILGTPRLEGVPEEIELDVFGLPRPVVILAVDNPGLHWVKLQTALLEPTPDGAQHR